MKGHEIALWSGVCSFFGSLISHGIFSEYNVDLWLQYLIGALIVGLIVGGSIFAKDKLYEARKKKDVLSDKLGTKKED